MNKYLRIGVMGSAGSGKTTLAHLLCRLLGIPLVDEGVREWLTNRHLKAPVQLSWDLQLQLQQHYLTAKVKKESPYKAFVSDRTTVDAVVNLLLRYDDQPGAHTQIPARFVELALSYAAKAYDSIVLLQWYGIPNATADGIRVVDPEALEREYYLCYSLCRVLGLRTIIVPALPSEGDIELLLSQLQKNSTRETHSHAG